MDNEELVDILQDIIGKLKEDDTNYGHAVEVAISKLYMAIFEGEVDRL